MTQHCSICLKQFEQCCVNAGEYKYKFRVQVTIPNHPAEYKYKYKFRVQVRIPNSNLYCSLVLKTQSSYFPGGIVYCVIDSCNNQDKIDVRYYGINL